MTIKEIRFKDNLGHPQNYIVGGLVTKIIEHTAKGEGDKWYYDVYCDNEIRRIFNPLEVIFETSDN